MLTKPSNTADGRSFQGYHSFPTDTEPTSDGFGSFEVWHSSDARGQWAKGWYWWACFPGCLPDGEPNGPFPTAEGAYLDAIEE